MKLKLLDIIGAIAWPFLVFASGFGAGILYCAFASGAIVWR